MKLSNCNMTELMPGDLFAVSLQHANYANILTFYIFVEMSYIDDPRWARIHAYHLEDADVNCFYFNIIRDAGLLKKYENQ